MARNKRLGDYFRKRSENGRGSLPTFSVTLNNGLVSRDTLERKMDTNLSPEDHLLIKEGDIAYNTMRMWQGASGLARYDGVVSPAYVVLAPEENMDSLFASYWFKSARMIYLFWAYSYGITNDRLRLYFKDFSKIPVTPPPLRVQKRAAAILSAWDTALERLAILIVAKRNYRLGLMQKLLTSECRFPGFNDKWTEVPLKKLGDFSKGAGVSKSDVVSTGYAAVRYGELYTTYEIAIEEVASRISESGKRASKPIGYGDILFAGSGEDSVEIGKSAVFLGREEAYAGGDIVIFTPRTGDPVFLAYALNGTSARRHLSSHAQGQTIVHIYINELRDLTVLLPSVEEQRRIARVLRTADREIAILEKEQAVLKKQKTGLVQQLFPDTSRTPAATLLEGATR